MQKQVFTKRDVADHYDDFNILYENWSGTIRCGYHFGIAKNMRDVFYNDKMVYNLSNYVIDSFGLKQNNSYVIFDAGCGVGDVTRMIIDRYQQANVYGMTISKEQYKLAQKKHPETQRSRVLRGDFENTGFDDSMFDIVFFIDSFCYGNGYDKERALIESYRLLKPGGKLIICDVFLQKRSQDWSRWFTFVNKKVIDLWHVNKWSVESDVQKKAMDIGYKNYHVDILTWRIVPSVLHIIFTKIPWACMKFLQDKKYIKEILYFLRLSIFAPLLGMHPTFRYQLVTLEKPKK